MEVEKNLSVVICTHNRSEILKKCLLSINLNCEEFKAMIEIVVIDNGSTDKTKSIIKEFKGNGIFQTKYYFEPEIGLSYARNAGARVSNHTWLFYLDDDGLVMADTLKNIFFVINNYNFQIFGGIYEAYYIGEKPKWISSEFGSKAIIQTEIGSLLPKETIEGGVMIINKEVFLKTGNFNINFGMKGSKIGYSEESEFIQRCKNQNISIGFSPFIKIYHLVGQHKYSILWHLKAYFILSRDKCRENDMLKINVYRTILLLPFRILKYGMRLIFSKNYYYQNFLWHSFSGVFAILGRLSCFVRK